MSDKNTYNEDFIDKGWQNMSAILDKEMPVKKKKKRFFILFFFFGLLSVITFGITLIPMGNSEMTSGEIIANESLENQSMDVDNNSGEIASLNKEIISGNLVREYEKSLTLKDNLSTKKQENKTLINTSKNNFNKVAMYRGPILPINNKSTINNKPVATSIINNEFSIKNNSSTTDKESITKEQTLVKDELSIIDNSKNQLLIKDKLIIDNYQFVIPIALEFYLLENEKIEEIKKIPNHFNPKKWNFGIEAGLVFQNKNELGGKVGFVATRHINKKWALHTGLEYNTHFINYAAEESASIFELSDDQVDNGVSAPAFQNYEAIYLNNSTKIISHHLKIPLLMAYRFNSSFEVNAGIVNSFNVYSRERNTDPSVVLLIPQVTIKSKTVKPLYDLQASLGLTYYPTKKWGVSLRYDYGFIKREITAIIPVAGYQLDIRSNAGIKGYGSQYRLLNFSAKMYF
jgi:hypothetical protein